MLIRLLRAYLRPYSRPIVLVVLLQLIQTLATLYLPTLNADIIDNGVVKGDTEYILRMGAFMLAVTLIQIVCSIIAVYFGAHAAAALGRDVRAGIFDQVQRFSAREVGHFGAPSLITRTTNDVQQVQMLTLMSFTLMHARPGETTAVIGSTGSGKTTLLNLVPRLFDATDGTVLVDGIDVRDLDPVVLAGTVGFVPQKPYLFTGTVASNLRYGKPDATDSELWRALEIAQARDFVEQMPGGLDAPIAQGGINVSGGQRQRLAIARVLVRRPEIYLFDDSFSALDYATDAALRTALARETAEATVVIVAQRVSTIRDADRILVLDEGQVVGVGTHSDLMSSNQTYREIVLSQLTEQEAA